MFFWYFLNVLFYELFCEGPSDLCKYALTAVRGLSSFNLWRIEYSEYISDG